MVAAGPQGINEGFEVPRVYKDGQSVVGVGKTADGAGGWVLDENQKDQNPDAFLAIAGSPAKAQDAKAARGIERAEREALREKEKDLDREAKKKAEQAREIAEKAAKVTAGLQTRPGALSLVPVQNSGQSIIRPLAEPLKAPFYMSVVLETDYGGGGFSIRLEDEEVDLPFFLAIHKNEERFWALAGGGAQGGLSCERVKGRHFFIAGIEPDPKNRGKWLIKGVVNPVDPRNPFQGGAGTTSFGAVVEFKDLVRLRIDKTGKFSGKIDEIRVGKSLRDVLP